MTRPRGCASRWGRSPGPLVPLRVEGRAPACHFVRPGPVRARTRLRRHEAARGFGDTRPTRAGLSLRTDRPGASSHEALGSPPRAICTVGVRKRRDAAPRLRLALGALAWPARAAARRGPRASRHSVRHGPVRARTRFPVRGQHEAPRGRLAPAARSAGGNPVVTRSRRRSSRLGRSHGPRVLLRAESCAPTEAPPGLARCELARGSRCAPASASASVCHGRGARLSAP